MHTNTTCAKVRSCIQSLVHMDAWKFPLSDIFSSSCGTQILGF